MPSLPPKVKILSIQAKKFSRKALFHTKDVKELSSLISLFTLTLKFAPYILVRIVDITDITLSTRLVPYEVYTSRRLVELEVFGCFRNKDPEVFEKTTFLKTSRESPGKRLP